jgi:hypothetical protein
VKAVGTREERGREGESSHRRESERVFGGEGKGGEERVKGKNKRRVSRRGGINEG